MMTIQNIARSEVKTSPIYHFRPQCAPNVVIDLDVQTCKDFPEAIGKELLKEFPFLQCIGMTLEPGTKVVAENITISEGEIIATNIKPITDEIVEPSNKPDFLENLQASTPIVCNQCGQHFKSHQGRKTHLTTKHP